MILKRYRQFSIEWFGFWMKFVLCKIKIINQFIKDFLADSSRSTLTLSKVNRTQIKAGLIFLSQHLKAKRHQ